MCDEFLSPQTMRVSRHAKHVDALLYTNVIYSPCGHQPITSPLGTVHSHEPRQRLGIYQIRHRVPSTLGLCSRLVQLSGGEDLYAGALTARVPSFVSV